jgi:diguanylate cyclase (GGDEF)-like protein
MDDIRYSELLFLQAIAKDSFTPFSGHDQAKAKAVGLSMEMYVDMAATLIEELYVRFRNQPAQLLVTHLRGELPLGHTAPGGTRVGDWMNPREGIRTLLNGQCLQDLCITYRGQRRIEELRDLLRRDRILEPFGVLLDIRYFLPDLQELLARGPDVPVSVAYADMDNFKPVNDQAGHAAGDVVMKAYLEVVRDCLGQFGTAYRGRGDETVCLMPGLGHQRAVEIAEAIRKGVAALQCEHNGKPLSKGSCMKKFGISGANLSNCRTVAPPPK